MKSSAPFQELSDSAEMLAEEERKDAYSEISAGSSLLHSSVQKSQGNFFKPSSLKVFKGSAIRGMKMKFRQHRRAGSLPQMKLQELEAGVQKHCSELALGDHEECDNEEKEQEDLRNIEETVHSEEKVFKGSTLRGMKKKFRQHRRAGSLPQIKLQELEAGVEKHCSELKTLVDETEVKSVIEAQHSEDQAYTLSPFVECDSEEEEQEDLRNIEETVHSEEKQIGYDDFQKDFSNEGTFGNDAIDRKDSLSSEKSSILLDLIRFEGAVKNSKRSELICTMGEALPKVITVMTADDTEPEPKNETHVVSTQQSTVVTCKQGGNSSEMEDTDKEELKVNLFGSATDTSPEATEPGPVIRDLFRSNQFSDILDAFEDLNYSPVLDAFQSPKLGNEVIETTENVVESKLSVQSSDAEINTSIQQQESNSIKDLCYSTVDRQSSIETPLPAKELLFQKEMLKTQERRLFKKFMEEFTPKKVNTEEQSNESPKDFIDQLTRDFTPKQANGKERETNQRRLKSIHNPAEYGAWDFEDFRPFWEALKSNVLTWQPKFEHINEISDKVTGVCPVNTCPEAASDKAASDPSFSNSGIELEYRPPRRLNEILNRPIDNLPTNQDQDGIISVTSEERKNIDQDEISNFLRDKYNNLPSVFGGFDDSIEHEVKDGKDSSHRNNLDRSGDSLAAFFDQNESLLSYGNDDTSVMVMKTDDNLSFEQVSFPSPSFTPHDHSHSVEVRNERSFELDALVSSFLADVRCESISKDENNLSSMEQGTLDIATHVSNSRVISPVQRNVGSHSSPTTNSALQQTHKEEGLRNEEKSPTLDLKVLDQLLTLIGSKSKDESILSNEAVDIIRSIGRLSTELTKQSNSIEENEQDEKGESSKTKETDTKNTATKIEKCGDDVKVIKTAQTMKSRREKKLRSSSKVPAMSLKDFVKGDKCNESKDLSPQVSTERSSAIQQKNRARSSNDLRSPQDIMNFPSSPNIQTWPSISERIAVYQSQRNHSFKEHVFPVDAKEDTDTYEV